MKNQRLIEVKDLYSDVKSILLEIKARKIFVVSGRSFQKQEISSIINQIQKECNLNVTFFSGFESNPKYESVRWGIEMFDKTKADVIFAIGGGSSIDVAKVIKVYSGNENLEKFHNLKYIDNNIPIIAMPTTAGTGSEATTFAVIYYQEKKYSIDCKDGLPEYVILNGDSLKSLPLYQKKSTLLDALCQSIESYWSLNANEDSKGFAKKSIDLIMKYAREYLQENNAFNDEILKAAYYSGKAINISKTTAAHAMSYKLTSMYGISHGHSVALCIIPVWKYMLCKVMENSNYNLEKIFFEIIKTLNENTIKRGIEKLENFVLDMELPIPKVNSIEEIDELVTSVNIERLSNNPVELSRKTLENLYMEILQYKED